MKYLYGDSQPFPLQYNFLQTLEVFVAQATRAVELEAQSRQLMAQVNEAAAMRSRNVDGLERFHQVVMRALQDSSSRSVEGLMVDYAQKLAEQAGLIVEGARSQAQSMNDRELAAVRAESERRRVEIRAATEQFFKVARLPMVEARLSARLPTTKEPSYEMSGVITFAEAIVVGYTIDTGAMDAWRHPRRVSEIAQGVNLMVGARKSWFKKAVQPELVALDEFYVSGFELADDSAQIRMRRKPDQSDSYIFDLRRFDTHLAAEVAHPDDPESGSTRSPVDAGDKAHLERLWQMLRKHAMPALEHKSRVVSVHLDGEEVFAADKVALLITRLVRILAPTVAEIAKRSPNPNELSLKIEHDGGRREELYLKKGELVSRIAALGPLERSVFAPMPLGQEEETVQIAPE